MTDAEKKMKKYVNAVERRLNLPWKIRSRVMSDFASSIQARRESGMTDDEIYAALGPAKTAAAELNEQMKEYAYRKSPWRFLFLPLAIYGGVELLLGLAVRLVYLFQSDPMVQVHGASVGIIGGADGPTAMFVTSPGWMHYINPALFLVIGICGWLVLCRPRSGK